MKIMILANNDIGLYKFRKELIFELLNDNEVIISVPDGEMVNLLVEKGCKFIDTPIDRRGMNPKEDLTLYAIYKKILKDENPDLVIAYTIKPDIYGGYACRRLNIPYVVNITGLGSAFQSKNFLRILVANMYKVGLKNAKAIFFENVGNRDVFIDEKIVSKDKTHVLMGAGVNLNEYCYMDYPNNNKTHFLFVGRVMQEKGVDELFEAMQKLIKEGYDCSLSVLGYYEEDYEDRIEKYEAEGWLKYYGFQKDVRPFIKECDCFVLPSWHEGMANTNLECAACGRPIITTNINGCLEAVIDGKTGFIVEKKSAYSLYEKMKCFLKLSEVERKNMGTAGRQLMQDKFNKEIVVSETIDIIFNNS